MANSLFRMVNSFARRGAGLGQAHTMRANSLAPCIVPEKRSLIRGISGELLRSWNPLKRWASCYSPAAPAAKLRPSIRFPPISSHHPPEISMTITAAHISPIVALIAGVLILIMPRFLNFIVAIYLIVVGLAGLGVFKMLRF
jgi:hypothetical protein